MSYQRDLNFLSSRLLRTALIGMALGSACFGGKVKSLAGKGADFASYKTYEWLPTKIRTGTGIVENDPELTPLIKQAVNEAARKEGASRSGVRGRPSGRDSGVDRVGTAGGSACLLNRDTT